jgi:hypothetical protein
LDSHSLRKQKMSKSGTKIIIGLFGLLAACGCGDENAMSKAEIEASKHPKPFTDAQRKAMGDAMARGAAAAAAQEKEWALAHKDQLAKVNAERARGGKPPLAADDKG